MPRVSRYVQTLNKPQQVALRRVFERCGLDANANRQLPGGKTREMNYRQFRKTVVFSFDCAMVRWCGMWLGIEQDGYTHS
jgi:hypothetical protein